MDLHKQLDSIINDFDKFYSSMIPVLPNKHFITLTGLNARIKTFSYILDKFELETLRK